MSASTYTGGWNRPVRAIPLSVFRAMAGPMFLSPGSEVLMAAIPIATKEEKTSVMLPSSPATDLSGAAGESTYAFSNSVTEQEEALSAEKESELLHRSDGLPGFASTFQDRMRDRSRESGWDSPDLMRV